jgi:hypothetical protein
MNDRGTYGSPLVGADPRAYGVPLVLADPGRRESSAWKWVVGGALVGGAILWARHESKQLARLNERAGLRPQSFMQSAREDVRALPTVAREALSRVRGGR